MKQLEIYQNILRSKSPVEIIDWCLHEFTESKIALSTSFSIEDQVITHLLVKTGKKPAFFTVDSGRLFQETFDTMQKTIDQYNIAIKTYSPDTTDLQRMMSENGPNFFYDSLESRKLCCQIRKVEPYQRALKDFDICISGRRMDQAGSRQDLKILEWDNKNRLYKLNPLINWTEAETFQFINDHKIPFNSLYNRGYRSIGCAPCTRAIGKNDDIRSGRWWWENPEHKECGIHL